MKRSLKLGWTLFLITGMTGLLLGLVHKITEGPIEKARTKEVRSALRAVLPKAESFKEIAGPQDAPSPFVELHEGATSTELEGYCVTVETKGYGGPIRFVVGVDRKGTVTGLTVLASKETPGLGARASESTFRNQFAGQHPERFTIIKNAEPERQDGEIEALSGATITSRAITDGVNAALETFRKIPKEGER